MTQESDKTTEVVRLTRRPQFLFVRGGWIERRKSLAVEARRRAPDGVMGEGFTATKKVGGAVIRNRAKRRLRAGAATLLPIHGAPGVDYVFIARKDTADIAWARLLDDMESALVSLARRARDT
ncbi:MAG: ribonuclease P protein component [Pseudomonadota bacterium]